MNFEAEQKSDSMMFHLLTCFQISTAVLSIKNVTHFLERTTSIRDAILQCIA